MEGTSKVFNPTIYNTDMEGVLIFKANPDTHTMGYSLKSYVEQKVHQDLFDEDICQIWITGEIQRQPPATTASFEKERMVDSRRPTTSWIDATTIQVNCFPCRNLVVHYASLIATHLEFHGRASGIVQMKLPSPAQTTEYLHKTNLVSIANADIAIIGDIYHLPGLWRGKWEGTSLSEHDIFRWNKFTTLEGRTVVLIGCVEKIWGEMGYELIHTIHKNIRMKHAIYIGKAGCLSKEYVPNQWIATGNQAFIDNEPIDFQSPLDIATKTSKLVAHGAIVTVPTPLCETKEWAQQWSAKALWVDCEVAYFAKAAVELEIEFGFLHIVSDNLYQISNEDLSNEELDVIIEKRNRLYKEIYRIIDLIL